MGKFTQWMEQVLAVGGRRGAWGRLAASGGVWGVREHLGVWAGVGWRLGPSEGVEGARGGFWRRLAASGALWGAVVAAGSVWGRGEARAAVWLHCSVASVCVGARVAAAGI